MTGHSADDMQTKMIALLPNLRAFARSLSGSADKADDLVQEALIRAWSNRSSFVPGTNLKAWMFTILRNAFISEKRKRRQEVEDATGALAERLSVHGEQSGHMDMVDFAKALEQLSDDQREAVILIGAEGFSYEEAAAMCGCPVGTMKSRVNRARARLGELLGVEGAADFGPEYHPAEPVRSVG